MCCCFSVLLEGSYYLTYKICISVDWDQVGSLSGMPGWHLDKNIDRHLNESLNGSKIKVWMNVWNKVQNEYLDGGAADVDINFQSSIGLGSPPPLYYRCRLTHVYIHRMLAPCL